MVVRLLIVLLALVGPMPFRVCTCSAIESHCEAATRPVKACCSCCAPATAVPDEHHHSSPPANHSPHHPDCPGSQARPAFDAMSPDCSPEVQPNLTGFVHTVPLPNLPAASRNVDALHTSRSPTPRLYIALQTLRN